MNIERKGIIIKGPHASNLQNLELCNTHMTDYKADLQTKHYAAYCLLVNVHDKLNTN
jgi:hypothetical protein